MPKETLEKRIDKSNDNIIQEKELLNFLNNKENVEELGKYLNTLGNNIWGDRLYNITQKIIEKSTLDISKKVLSNESLPLEEKSIIKVQYYMEKNALLSDHLLNFYIRTRYNNSCYMKDMNMNKKTKKIIKKEDIQFVRSDLESTKQQLLNRVSNAYPEEYKTFVQNKQKEHAYKHKDTGGEAIAYDSIMFAFSKYLGELDKDDKKLMKDFGYYDKVDTTLNNGQHIQGEIYGGRNVYACEKFIQSMEKYQYKGFEDDMSMLNNYNSKLQKLFKHTGYNKQGLLKKHKRLYENCLKEIKGLQKKDNYKEIIASIKEPDINNKEDVEKYLENMNKVQEYSKNMTTIQSKYGTGMLKGYETVMQGIQKINKDSIYISDVIKRITIYDRQIATEREELGISDEVLKKYISYQNKRQESGVARKYALVDQFKTYFEDSIHTPSNRNNNPFPNLRQENWDKVKNQRDIDMQWKLRKQNSPMFYRISNAVTGLWNGLTDATVGVGSGLGLLIMSCYKDEHEMKAAINYKKDFDSKLKYDQSSKQLEAPVKNGKWNLKADNTVAQVGAQVSNMLVLLTGAGGIARGATSLGLKTGMKLGQKAATKVGLFSFSMIQHVGSSFESGISEGLSTKEAFSYAMISSVIASSLELLAPNDMFFNNYGITKIMKQLTTPASRSLFVKEALKNLGKEMGEEIIQENLQLVAEKGINAMTNEVYNSALDSSLCLADFITTAVLTGLTTGIVSSHGSYKGAKLTTGKNNEVKQWIIKDNARYNDYKNKLDSVIAGETNVGVSVKQAQELLSELEKMRTINNQLDSMRIKEELDEATKNNDQENFNTIIKGIWINRNNLGFKTILSTLNNVKLEYKKGLKEGFELIINNINTDPNLVFKGLEEIVTNFTKLDIVIYNFIPFPLIPVPGAGKAMLLCVLATEFKSKGPMYQGIMELYQAVKQDSSPSSVEAKPNISQKVQEENSLNSDKLVDKNGNINPEAKEHTEKFMRDNRALNKGEILTDRQVRKIYEVHNMKIKEGETDDVLLNKRKAKVLIESGLFTREQRRVLMEGKVCGTKIKLEEKDRHDSNLENVIKKHGVSIIHGITTNFNPGTADNVVPPGVSWQTRIKTIIAVGAGISTSSIRPEYSQHKYWRNFGVFISKGIVSEATAFDGGTHSNGIIRPSSNKLKSGEMGEEISQAINIGETHDLHNELVVNNTEVSGIYIIENARSGGVPPSVYIDDFSKETNLPVYIISDGKIWETKYIKREGFVKMKEVENPSLLNSPISEEVKQKIKKEIYNNYPVKCNNLPILGNIHESSMGHRKYIQMLPTKILDDYIGKEGIYNGTHVEELISFKGVGQMNTLYRDNENKYFIGISDTRTGENRTISIKKHQESEEKRYEQFIDKKKENIETNMPYLNSQDKKNVSHMNSMIIINNTAYELFGFAEQAKEFGDLETFKQAVEVAEKFIPYEEYLKVIAERLGPNGEIIITEEDLK